MPLNKKPNHSKRQTLKMKYMIKKKAKATQKKTRRATNQKGAMPGTRALRKDPGIPSLLPQKEKLIASIRATREIMQAEDARRHMNQQKIAAAKRLAAAHGGDLARLAAQANIRNTIGSLQLAKTQSEVEAQQTLLSNTRELTQYRSELNQVIAESDVILQVLDARDPLSCRSVSIEQSIAAANKRLVFVLNKVDLVPPEIVEGWLHYLRQEHPTIPFRAATESGNKGGIARVNTGMGGVGGVSSRTAVGADELLQLLKNYTRQEGTETRTTIVVGVVGFPNTGKSSIINSLCRRKVVATAPVPGYTKKVQQVQLDKSIQLFDSPGVVTGQDAHDSQGQMVSNVLRSVVRIEKLLDPFSPVEELVRRSSKEALMEIFSIGDFEAYSAGNAAEGFVRAVALAKGKVKKGGVPDMDGAARFILQQWVNGRIPFFVAPPGGVGSNGGVQ